jgi:ankyrin repeat protein
VNLACDNKGRSPIYEALSLDDELSVEMCQTLVELGASLTVACENSYGMTPYQAAVHEENLALVSFFVEQCGADPGGAMPDGKPIMELAHADSDVRAYLLSAQTGREIESSVSCENADSLVESAVRSAPRSASLAL